MKISSFLAVICPCLRTGLPLVLAFPLLLASAPVSTLSSSDARFTFNATEGFDTPATGGWTFTGSLNPGRYAHTATLLPNGKVLVAFGGGTSDLLSGAELYDPASGNWSATGSLNPARDGHTATLLPNGKVLAAGGEDHYGSLASAELYNPATGSWSATGSLNVARRFHTATLLPNGKMLVVGGLGNGSYFEVLQSAELYNPASGTWTFTGSLNIARVGHTATLLPNGMVLVAGGEDFSSSFASAELYNPATGSWIATDSLNTARAAHTATLLPNGMVLVAAGYDDTSEAFASAELYDPASGTWTFTGSLNTGRDQHTATLLPDGKVLVAGGFGNSGSLASAELYDPAIGSWSATGSLNTARYIHTATLLQNGNVLVAGGLERVGNDDQVLSSAELYDTAGPMPPSAPTANPATFVTSSGFTANWSGLGGATGYRLDVSTNSSFNSYVTGYQNLNVGNLTSRGVIGLNANTTYYYRVRAYNGIGTSGNSNTITLTTLTPTGAPVVTTNPATNAASFSATLNGTVNPHGLTATLYFEYGTTTSYGSTTAFRTKTGNTYQSVSVNIDGLSASTIYHFRIVATNSAGTRYGTDRTFTTLSATGPPVVTTNPATLIASFSATLNGSLDPHGLTTNVYFQYGTTTSYGFTTPTQSKTGNMYQNVAGNISSLSANTVYHYRIVATNGAGTRYGSDRTFTTLTATGPPVVTTNPATNLTSSSVNLNGSLDPHGLTTSVYFQYGTTNSYGHTTPMQSQTGNTYRNITANISSLTTHSTYHFRIVAANSAGTTYGGDRTFTTP